MKHVAFAFAALCCFAGNASADVDPLNWCPDRSLSINPTPQQNALRQAFVVQHTSLAPGPFSPSNVIATIDLVFAAQRPVVSAQSQTNMHAGDLLTPVWMDESWKDALSQGPLLYCAVAATPITDQNSLINPYRPAVCLAPNRDGTTSWATAARFENEPSLSGRMSLRPSFGRNQDWATLGRPRLDGRGLLPSIAARAVLSISEQSHPDDGVQSV